MMSTIIMLYSCWYYLVLHFLLLYTCAIRIERESSNTIIGVCIFPRLRMEPETAVSPLYIDGMRSRN